MLILSDKWITTKCQPPDLRAWVADLVVVERLGPQIPSCFANGSSPTTQSGRTGGSLGSSWMRNSRQCRWWLLSSTPHSR